MKYSVITQQKKTPFLLKETWLLTLKLGVEKVILLAVSLLIFGTLQGFSQETISDILKKYNTQSVPYISVQELAMPKTKAILLDAREQREFDVSHLKDAIYVGYDNFNLEETIKQLENKKQNIVVYCTLGVRSEDIAEQLKSAGYTNVQNLYGGIVEWKNNNFKVYDANNKETENVHVCNDYWSQWLTRGNKVFDENSNVQN